MCHEKVPRPLGEVGPSCCYRVVGFKGSLERAKFCIGEANEQSGASMLNRRSSSPWHDFVISVTPESSLDASAEAVVRTNLVCVRSPIRFRNDVETSH